MAARLISVIVVQARCERRIEVGLNMHLPLVQWEKFTSCCTWYQGYVAVQNVQLDWLVQAECL